MKENLLFLWFLLFIPVSFGQISVAGQATPTPVQLDTKRTKESLVHFGDIIDIDVVGSNEYDWRGTLTPDGNLDGLDEFKGPIRALCRTESEISSDVASALSKTLRDPHVEVKIVDRSNRAVVRLEGAVKTPSRFKLMRPVELRELLVIAGGFTEDLSGEITIFSPRNLNCSGLAGSDKMSDPPQDNGLHRSTIKITDLLKGDATANVQILSGDTIDVAKADPVYVIGAVNSPRPVYSRAEITVSRAVASAGGLAKDSEGGKVSIFRRDATETHVIEADLLKIKRGESVDLVLKPFDIIDVASKGGRKRKYPPLTADVERNGKSQHELPLRVID